VKYSWPGVVKGMFLRMPTLMKSMFMGNIPWRIKGRMDAMPMNFLVNERGVIEVAYYGQDEGDHLSMVTISAFSHDGE
jgi:thioredoxin-dependent peroxiredoxin